LKPIEIIGCLIEKKYKVKFPKNDPSQRKEVLEFVHSYVCDLSEKYLGDAYYFVYFIDD